MRHGSVLIHDTYMRTICGGLSKKSNFKVRYGDTADDEQYPTPNMTVEISRLNVSVVGEFGAKNC